jgi:hypothetical protein
VNENLTSERRRLVGSWRDELKSLQTDLLAIANFGNTNLAASDILSHASSFLQDTHPQEARTVIESLDRFAEEAKTRCNVLAERIADATRRIEHAYDEFPRESEYRLHAILVHSGSPDLGGHYWTYIRDHKSGVWFKFNDVTVNRVEKTEEMFAQSFGDPAGATSAYALVYVKITGQAEAWNTCQGVPVWARMQVTEDNAVFQAEVQRWRVEHPMELSREEKQKNFEAGMADLLTPPVDACFKFSQYAYKREQPQVSFLVKFSSLICSPQRILELIVYSEVGLEPNERALDVEQNIIDGLRKDFDDYQKLVGRLVQAMKTQNENWNCSAYLAEACRNAHAHCCGHELFKMANACHRTTAQNATFSAHFMCDDAVLPHSVRQERLLLAWGASFYVQDSQARRELLQTWKGYAKERFQKFEQVKSLILNDKPPPPPAKPNEVPWSFETCAYFNKHFPTFVQQLARLP